MRTAHLDRAGKKAVAKSRWRNGALRAAMFAAIAFPLAGCGGSDVPITQGPIGAANPSSERLTVVNNCGDDVWLIETPPGAVAAVQKQWDWFVPYATQTNTLPNGGVVAAVPLPAGSSKTFSVPDKGAPGGNFRFYMRCPQPGGAGQPGGPFDPRGCTIGSAAGDLASINTLFEPTFGCRSGSPGCAFNPAAPADACRTDPGPDTCPPLASGDNFDISTVDGYTLPMKVEASNDGGSCNRLATDAGMLDLASCPHEDDSTLYTSVASQQALIAGIDPATGKKGISLLSVDNSTADKPLRACAAVYKWFESDTLGSPPSPVRESGACDPANGSFGSHCYYSGAGCDASDPATSCPNNSGPQQKVGPKKDGSFAIQNTNWVQQLFAMGYRGYTWQYGDKVGDQSCNSSSTYKLTLCPAGGVPYRSNQLWTFSPGSGTCDASPSSGAANGVTSFDSLFACQKANMRFTCEDVSEEQYGTRSAMWRADAGATLAGIGVAYDTIATLRKVDRSSYTIDAPRFGRLTVPEQNYLYGNPLTLADGTASFAPCP